MALRRLIRSLPTRKGVLGVATCDKGLPAMTITSGLMKPTNWWKVSQRADGAAPLSTLQRLRTA